MAQVKSVYLKANSEAKDHGKSSITCWILSFTFLTISENYYFSWVTQWLSKLTSITKKTTLLIFQGKHFSLSLWNSNSHLWGTLYRTVSCPENEMHRWCLQKSSYPSARCHSPGLLRVSPAWTPWSISGQGKKHVLSGHQWYIQLGWLTHSWARCQK